MSAVHVRSRQVSAVKQLLSGKPEGHTRQELQALLGKRADPKQLIATLNTMKSTGILRATRCGTARGGAARYTLATENLLQPAVPARRRSISLTPAQADHARFRAAAIGTHAVIPPAATATSRVESVEQWMARTGKQPEVLPHNFDTPRTSYPGRRPSVPAMRYTA